MSKPRVYLETTVVSFLCARTSRDLVQAAHQEVTWEWWESRRQDFDLFVSPVVEREISAGDSVAAARRLEMIEGIPSLEVTDRAIDLAADILAKGALPPKAADDALHLAVGTVHRMDYLATWNCRHLANMELMARVAWLVEARGYTLPVVCVPEELLGD
jgi:hypothetical protein